MIKRLAVVLWWIGAAFRLVAALGFAGSLLFGGNERWGSAFGFAAGFGFLWLFSWTLAFILGGSFRKPPTLN